MLDPKDLRIGNLVSCEAIGDTYTDRKPYYGECIYAVTGLRGGFVWLDIGHDAEQKVPCDHVQPIPITEERLKMAGFEKSKSKSDKWYDLKCFGINFMEGRCVQGIDNVFYNQLPYPTSVHQLQNLYFALAGEELQFKTQQP